MAGAPSSPPSPAAAVAGRHARGRVALDRLWAAGRRVLGCRHAIMGGAMTWVSERNLVAAISTAGGFGVIACGAMEPDRLDEEIEATRALTDRPFGVNLIIMHPRLEALIDVCLAHGVGHVVLAGGVPGRATMERVKAGGARLLCFAPSLGLARRLARAGADALIIEGMEAGGHIGPVATGVLAQEILPHMGGGVPVFVAGGIGHGEAIAAYLRMGAAGVQIGTRLVCAEESIAHPAFKEAFLRASARDAVPSVQVDPEFKVIPVRALANRATARFMATQHDVIARYRRGELTHEEASLAIEHFWAGALRRAVIDGDVEHGSLMAGQSVGLVTRIEPTAAIIEGLVDEAAASLEREIDGGAAAPDRGRSSGGARVIPPSTPSGWGAPHAGGGLPPAVRHGAAGASAARLLLRRLVEVMAEPVSPQERLDRIVRMIARDIVAEVCSVYVLRAGDVLELFATEGLRPSAVHHTRLRVGQGLVGLIAAQGRVINLSDAQSHPNFVYRPETGEEVYHSFLGVPIAPGGRVAGVLVVQNRARRHYTDEEVEALQIVGTVLAQMLAAGTPTDASGLLAADFVGRAMGPRRLEGLRLVEGVATGVAVLHQPRIEVSRLLADDPEVETRRLERAVASLRDSVDELLALPEIAGGEQRDVLEAYRMFANDAGWLRRMREAIRTGLSAEAAVKRVQEETRLRMGQVTDSYLRERLLDLDELAYRLLRHLVGAAARGHDPAELPEAFVLVARGLGPAELLEYDRGRLQGVILEEGSPTAHVTIVARALDIPMLGRVEGALSAIAPGDRIALDGDHGQAYVRPSEDVEQAFSRSLRVRAERRRHYAALRDRPAVTRDGMRVSLSLNAAFLVDLPHLDATGADGIGLYRTELAFMGRDCHPAVADQTELYRKVLDQAGGRPVVFRTLDVGGDKHLPYWHFPHEDNPAMGWRAIRMALDRPAVLRGQLRALVRAAAGRTLSVMFPMVAEVAEFDAARRLLDMELVRARSNGQTPPEAVRVGTMLEVPALFWQLPALLRRIDFLAVGSNDLMQFLFACDRGNPQLIDRYDVLSPPVLSFLRELVQRCREAGVQLSVCGEMASRPLEAMVLVGLGLRHLSVSPSDVGPVKAMLASLPCARLSGYLTQLYDLPDHSLRARLRNYAMDHGVSLYTEGFVAA